MPSTRDMLRRVLGWLNSQVLEPIRTNVDRSTEYTPRQRRTGLTADMDRMTTMSVRARDTGFNPPRNRS